MPRPAIPADLRRAVLVEAGHRCAIPRCSHIDVDIHHIIPWETCQKHEYDSLIALCPNCHRRAHAKEIDRTSLRIYKKQLLAEFASSDTGEFAAPVVEIKRRLSELHEGVPGFDFAFEFPDFLEPAEKIVSRNIEAWGNELLLSYRHQQEQHQADPLFPNSARNWLRGSYEVVRRDSNIVSVCYRLVQYGSGAAHPIHETRVQNFAVSPFRPLTLDEILISSESVKELAEICRDELLSMDRAPLNREWVLSGTEPRPENFSRYVIEDHALCVIFSEYQVASYAEGEQRAWLPFGRLKGIIRPDILESISSADAL